jgi:hypothetical protein
VRLHQASYPTPFATDLLGVPQIARRGLSVAIRKFQNVRLTAKKSYKISSALGPFWSRCAVRPPRGQKCLRCGAITLFKKADTQRYPSSEFGRLIPNPAMAV